MQFVNQGPGRPRPKAGYRCKICGKEGGLPDSHWYQLCPFKGKSDERKVFNPPRKGYVCKFCHKPGGDPDSHWFQQCPKRFDYEGIQVPHPLKLRAAATNSGMLNMMGTPQTLAAQTAAVAMNLGILPQLQTNQGQNQIDYTQQFTANALGMFMYPGQSSVSTMSSVVNNQQLNQQIPPQNMMGQNNVSQINPMQQQLNQQQLYYMHQQNQQQQTSSLASSSNPMKSLGLNQASGLNSIVGKKQDTSDVDKRLYEGFPGLEEKTFGLNINSPVNDITRDQQLLSEITKKTKELTFQDKHDTVESAVKAE